ncbi:N-alpha-acetyltransferase 30A-like [Anopheles darlingi]|uniref:N-alpha-acetyltransferase 30A-like n=1 Tax=Anopheles darlingi TaxID=43151 RepID=UPI002100093D|nr:N-alpha-acetyltransferase 30A-like [Anopheles darlingi]
MDVIIGHDVPTAASATKTNTSSTTSTTSTSICGKHCNGTVVGEAETVKEVVTGGAAPAGAGRKKTKRKNRAKNSQREETAADDTATAVEGSVLTTTTVPSSSAKAAGDVNSSNHNDRSSHGTNGLPDPQLEDAVDAISKKLEQCVHVGRNGLTNGLPKLEQKDSNGDERGSESIVGAQGGTPSSGATSKKSKQRARQQKKAQHDVPHCTALPNGAVRAEDSEASSKEEQTSSRSSVSNTASSGVSMKSNCKLDAASASTAAMVEVNIGKVEPEEQQPSTNVAPATAQSLGCGAASTSSCSLPKATTAAAVAVVSGDGDSGLQKEMLSLASTVPAAVAADITYQVYESERQMPAIMALIQKDLSEPYSIYTYRYFIHNWPKLCFLAQHNGTCVGAIVCKLDIHRENIRRGYIAMLAVDKDYRKLKIGTTLVQKAIQVMLDDKADEVVLETEITNQPALRLYENLGFVRDKRLFHYYLNGVDALRLKLWFR